MSWKKQLGKRSCYSWSSGGVDFLFCATLLNKAIGKNLTCIFVDHGMRFCKK